jgi:hypothetical protein
MTPTDAERQTALTAANYLNRALRMLAERCNLETSLERDPAGFAVQFSPMLAALIGVQSREFQSWVIFDRLENLADTHGRAVEDLANVFSDRLKSLDESLLSGLSDLAEHWEEMNAKSCRECERKARRASYQGANNGD